MHTTDAAVLAAAGAEGATYALLKSFDEPVTAYTGDADGLEAWVEETTIPLVRQRKAQVGNHRALAAALPPLGLRALW
jgi:hypothetical protein